MKKIKYILHIDMDAFFASIEQRDNPNYRNKPICVGSSPSSRGVVSTCSYEARRYGIHSAMPSSIAKSLCPEAIFIKPRIRYYSQISKQIFSLLGKFSPEVFQVSIDEAYIDITGMVPYYKDYTTIGKMIKEDIKRKFDLTCSIGIAPCKMLAKIASDLKKPDGFVFISKENVEEFIESLDIKKIPGIGKKTIEKLNKYGIYKMRDFYSKDIGFLKEKFGNWVESLYFKTFLKENNLKNESKSHSISTESTFDHDIEINETLIEYIRQMVWELSLRLTDKDLKAKGIGVKVRDSNFKTYQKQKSFSQYSINVFDFEDEVVKLFKKLCEMKLKKEKIRLIGVKFFDIVKTEDILFNKNNKEEILLKKINEINKKYNSSIIKKGFR